MSTEVELRYALKRLKDIEYALNESTIVSITDRKGIIQFVNDKLCQISKYSKDELIGQDHRIMNSGYHPKSFFKELWTTVLNGNIWSGEVRNRAKDGSFFWADTTIVPFLNKDGKPYQFITIRHDITSRKQIEQEMALLAYFDALTGLPNRNLLNRWVLESLANNTSKDKIAVLFLDLDHFKSINDTFGHNVGDIFFKGSWAAFKSCIPDQYLISRHGGDEFIVILNKITSNEDIIHIANRIIEQISLPFKINGHQIYTSTSIGICVDTLTDTKKDLIEFIELLIKQADFAMYYAKKQGGSSYYFHTPMENKVMERHFRINKEITSALEKNEFYIVYQPLVDLETAKIIGTEALLRWNHSELGDIPPSEFIPILEENSLIIPVGKWVIETACRQMKVWMEQGLPFKKMAVNVSVVQFRNHVFVEDVKEILCKTGIESKYLEIEVTESTLINIEESIKKLIALKELGVKIAIDDFGTGYSSLSYLKKIPIDTLKIDKSFISELDRDGEIIVNTIIQMGNTLKYTVTAEGIENHDQLNYLKEQNCHEGQGYLFSKPVHSNEIPNIIN